MRLDCSRHKRADRLQLHAELMSELPLYFFQTPLSFIFLLQCFDGAHCKFQFQIITGSCCIAHVCGCHILSVNFIGHQQNKSFCQENGSCGLSLQMLFFGRDKQQSEICLCSQAKVLFENWSKWHHFLKKITQLEINYNNYIVLVHQFA